MVSRQTTRLICEYRSVSMFRSTILTILSPVQCSLHAEISTSWKIFSKTVHQVNNFLRHRQGDEFVPNQHLSCSDMVKIESTIEATSWVQSNSSLSAGIHRGHGKGKTPARED